MPRLTKPTLLLFILLLPAPPARADDRATDQRDIDQDIAYVLDPHTGPHVRAAAIHRLGEQGELADRALPALLRQTHRGPTAVREAARDAVMRIAGWEKGPRYLAVFPPAAANDTLPGAVFRMAWLSIAGKWPAAAALRTVLADTAPDAPRRAIAAAVQLVRSDPRPVQTASDQAKTSLAIGLDEFDRADPSARADVLELVEAVGPGRARCVQLLLRIQADDAPKSDPALRDRAARLLAAAVDPAARTPETFAGLAAALADPDTKLARAAESAAPKDAPGPLKAALAYEVARRVERGDADAITLLKRHDVDADTFAQAVRRRFEANEADTPRLHLVRALALAGAGPAVAKTQGLHALIVNCLGRPAALAEQAARAERLNRAGNRVATPAPTDLATADALAAAARDLLLAASSPRSVEQTLATAIAQGQTLTPPLIRSFQPDRSNLARLLQPHLTNDAPAVRLSAAKTLAAVGVPADAADTRAALDACLRSPDPDLRHAAAEALDTPAARDLLRIPDLLRDLAADAPGARQVAARQLQSLAVDAPEITTLLVRATDQGDLATREGLCLALEQSFTTARPAREILTTLAAPANTNPTTRAYARAALHHLQRP